ncbi:MAG: hypothetical protein ACYC99_11465 [Candidatus Geothermincolia bacterium]
MLIYNSGERHISIARKMRFLQQALDIDPTNERTIELIQEERERQKHEACEDSRHETDNVQVSKSRKWWVIARISGTCLGIAGGIAVCTSVSLNTFAVSHPAWIFWVIGGVCFGAFLVLELVSRKKTPDLF